MSRRDRSCRLLSWLLPALLFVTSAAWSQEPGSLGLGREPSEAELAAFGESVLPSGQGLPEGQGTARQGDCCTGSGARSATATTLAAT